MYKAILMAVTLSCAVLALGSPEQRSTHDVAMQEQLPRALAEVSAVKAAMDARYASFHSQFMAGAEAAQQRGFSAQAVTRPAREGISAKDFNSGMCNAATFATDLTTYNTGGCGSYSFAALQNDTSTSAQVEAVCGSPCMQKLIDLYKKHSRCIPGLNLKDAVYFSNYVQLSCKRTANNDRCVIAGRVISELDCSSRTTATCASNNNCYVANGKCEISPRPATLQKLCNRCIFAVLRLFTVRDPTKSVTNMLIKSYICRRHKGIFCLARVSPVLDDRALFSFQAPASRMDPALDKICKDNTTAPCFRGIVAIRAAIEIQSQANTFRRCVKMPISAAAKRTQCWDPLQQTYVRMAKERKIYQTMCRKNPMNGKYCFSLFSKMRDHSCATAVATAPHTCTAACDPVIRNFVRDIGCCGAVMNSLIKENSGKFDPRLQPGGSNTYTATEINTTIATLTPDQKWNQHVLKVLGNCASLSNADFRKNMTTPCVKPRSRKVVRIALALNAVYSNFANNSGLQAKLLASLVEDTASSVGLNEDQFVGGSLAEDSSRTITTSHRHFGALSGNGATASMDVESESDAEADSAKSDTEDSLTSEDYSASTSEGTVSNECTDCMSADGELVDASSSGVTSIDTTDAPGATTDATTMAPGGMTGTTDSPSGSNVTMTGIPGAPGGTTAQPGTAPVDSGSASAVASAIAVLVAAVMALLA